MTGSLVQPKHLVPALKSLHWRSSLEIHKLLKDHRDLCIVYNYGEEEEGPSQKINVEKMIRLLPMHLMAVLMANDRDDMYQHVLCGIRLLNTLCELTPRHAKLEQVLLDDVKISAQILDLVFLVVIMLGGNRKETRDLDKESLLEATLVSSSLYLLHGFISPIYQDLVLVLLAHPRADVFIDSAFGSVHNIVRSLRVKLLYRRNTDQPENTGVSSVEMVEIHCQQAEAALQFLNSLCQHKTFRDRLAKKKELCGKGGVLMLALTILSLTVTPEFVGAATAIASISRMKAKVLSILQLVFEAESVSFLDEVASAGNLDLAKSIASEVLELLRLGFSKASKASAPPDYPMGFVLLNAMRLADVLTDDSNFRPFFTEHFSMVLSSVFCLSHGDFLSMLCSSDISSREDDVTLDYDLFTSAGWVLSVFSSTGQSPVPQFKLNFQNNLTMSSYAHQKTSLIIKIIANLHCFVPDLCKEQERNRFIQNFMSGLRKDPSSILANLLPSSSYTPVAQRGTGVCRNLGSLLRHAESLIPIILSDEDFVIFRVFCDQLQPLIQSEFEESQTDDIQSGGGDSSCKQQGKEPLNLNNEEASESSDVRMVDVATKQSVNEEMEVEEQLKESDGDGSNLETSGSDTSSNRDKSLIDDRVQDGDLAWTLSTSGFKGSASGEAKEEEDERGETFLVFEKQRKRRKRSIMNDDQVGMIEKALVDEPDMQRNTPALQLWADKLSQTGSEVITPSQLKNWLNNRKAKLARANKQGVVFDNNSSGDLAESPGDENIWNLKPLTSFKDQFASSSAAEEGVKQRAHVALMDERGYDIGRGIVTRTEGEWYGLSLDTRHVCVVDVTSLSVSHDFSKWNIPYGSDVVGKTFGEAESKFGVMRVAWDVNKLHK
ncbi:unnamed protein product [Cochlearia groenlandica]